MKQKKPIRCKVCGYEWLTTSVNRMVSCPSCQIKTSNPHYIPHLKLTGASGERK